MISVKNLKYRYAKSAEDTLKGIDFSLDKGEIFGFLGPSGAGKSTTQKILYKMLEGYEGEVLLEGKPLSKIDAQYFHRIGVGFELPNHYPKLTARENLKLFGQFYDQKKLKSVDELLDNVGLLDATDKRVETFSKGMKMRLNFVRAIQHDPEILFFDEPTSGMDPGNAALIKDLILAQKAAGKAIFITTHNMFIADQLCDRVAFLHDGNIVATDSPTNFKLKYGQDLVRVLTKGNEQMEEFPLAQIGQNQDFLALIAKNEIKTIHTLEASLEEVFLKITGKTLGA